MKLSEAFVEVGLDTKPLSGALGKLRGTLSGRLKSIGSAAGRAFSTAFTAGATAGLAALAGGAAFAAFSVKVASDAEEIGSKFSAVFKELSADTEVFAKDFAAKIGRSTIDVKQQLSSIQDTLKPLGFGNKEAAGLSKQLTGLVADLASFNNEAESEVLAKMTSGLVGNTEAWRSWGVVVTQATLDQELINRGIVGGVRAATEQQKVLARMAILMRSTTDAQGDALRTAGSFANSMRGLTGALKDFTAEVGNIFLPAAGLIVGRLRDATTWLMSNTEAFDRWGELLAEITDNLIRFGSEVLNSIVAPLKTADEETKSFSDTVTDLLEALALISADPVKGFDIVVDFLKGGFMDVAASFTATLLNGIGSVLSFVGESLPKMGTAFGKNIRQALLGFDAEATRGKIAAAEAQAKEFEQQARQTREGTVQHKNIFGGRALNILGPSADRLEEMAAAERARASELQEQLDIFDGTEVKGYFKGVADQLADGTSGFGKVVADMQTAAADLRAEAEQRLGGARAARQAEREAEALWQRVKAARPPAMPEEPSFFGKVLKKVTPDLSKIKVGDVGGAVSGALAALGPVGMLPGAVPALAGVGMDAAKEFLRQPPQEERFQTRTFGFENFAASIQASLGGGTKEEKEQKKAAEAAKKAADILKRMEDWFKGSMAKSIAEATKGPPATFGSS